MIQVQNITKSFDGFRALDDLSFTVPHGAVYGLVGPNGAGKSTVLRCIMGIYRPDAGLVSVGGLPVWENPAVKRRMAFIPDDLSAHAGDSIREMAGLMQKLYPRFDLSRYGQLREVFQLDEKKPLRRFSKGMQKQAAFWLAICAKPDYLILDEPVDGLDPVMRRQIWSIILEDVAAHETTVLTRRTTCASWRTFAITSASCTMESSCWNGAFPICRTTWSRCSSSRSIRSRRRWTSCTASRLGASRRSLSAAIRTPCRSCWRSATRCSAICCR